MRHALAEPGVFGVEDVERVPARLGRRKSAVLPIASTIGDVWLCHTISVSKNLNRRAHVILPIDVVADIDKLVGKRGRSAFLTEVARDEIQRRQQRNALHAAKGAWRDEDHPELKDGATAWVNQMRSEAEIRFQEIEQHRDRS